jgi:general secretion pathway protein D
LTVTLVLPATALAGFDGNGKKNFKEGVKYAANQQWDLAAQEFALAVAAAPDNAEYRAHYMRSLMQASIMYVKRGDTLAEQNDYASAYNQYRLGYNYDPSNELAKVKMQRC